MQILVPALSTPKTLPILHRLDMPNSWNVRFQQAITIDALRPRSHTVWAVGTYTFGGVASGLLQDASNRCNCVTKM